MTGRAPAYFSLIGIIALITKRIHINHSCSIPTRYSLSITLRLSRLRSLHKTQTIWGSFIHPQHSQDLVCDNFTWIPRVGTYGLMYNKVGYPRTGEWQDKAEHKPMKLIKQPEPCFMFRSTGWAVGE